LEERNQRGISFSMRPQSILMAAAGVAVLALGVYLFIEVRSAPAAVTPPSTKSPEKAATPAPTPEAAPEPKQVSIGKAPETLRPAAPTATINVGDRHDPEPTLDQHADQATDALMDQANKAYDHQEFDDARNFAGKVLAKDPSNIRMLRIMVSAACVEVDQSEATKWYGHLPPNDQAAMRTRCQRYGITFGDGK
jgi:hypothetical protein